MSAPSLFPEELRFRCFTPLGRAECWGWDADLPDPEWFVWQVATGEPFWWQNKHIRREPNVTNALMGMSPFGQVNREMQRHIERYKKMGALAESYDPGKVLTWP